VADGTGIARPASGAGAVAREGRSLSPDRPRRAQLSCWFAAIALHAAAVALAVLYNAVPARLELAPIPIEFVTVEGDGPDPMSPSVEPVIETGLPQAEPPPAPVEAAAIELAPMEPPVAPTPEPPQRPAIIVNPPRPRPPREIVQRPPPLAMQPTEPRPAIAAPIAEVPLATAQDRSTAEAIARPALPPARIAPGRDSDYVGKLLGWLERFKEYPRAARLRRIEGQVMLELSIMADGQIASAKVVTGSGNPVLDDAALEMVRRAAPVPMPNDGPLALRVPVMFALGAR
jgi:periplasmic protein TonB